MSWSFCKTGVSMTGSFFDAVIALTVTFKTLFDEQRFLTDDTPPENDESQYCIL
jgi:hypothetical protein